MKKLLLLLSLICLTGCVSKLPISANEECALQGMKLAGVSMERSTSYNSGSINGANYKQSNSFSMVGVSNSNTTFCEVPRSRGDQCIIKGHKSRAITKLDFNERVVSRNFMAGVGYMLYILPGVYLYYQTKEEREKATEISLKNFKNALFACSKDSKLNEDFAYFYELDSDDLD